MGLSTKKPPEEPRQESPTLSHIIYIYKDTKGEWRTRIKSINGNIIADSGESYKNLLDCRRTFENLRHAFQNGTYRVEVEGEE